MFFVLFLLPFPIHNTKRCLRPVVMWHFHSRVTPVCFPVSMVKRAVRTET